MRRGSGVLAALLAVVALSFSGPPPSTAAEPLMMNGAGATFPYPLYSKWFYEYSNANPGVKFNYQSIGSGASHPSSIDGALSQWVLCKVVGFFRNRVVAHWFEGDSARLHQRPLR